MDNIELHTIKTSYQRDYVDHNVRKTNPPKPMYFDPLQNLRPIKQPPQIDIETLYSFNDVYVPYDLLFRPKDGVNTNPHKKIPVVKLEDKIFEEKLEQRKIRRRVYMIPQICLDDVPEDVMYGENGLAGNIYSSDWKKSSELVQKVTECKNNSKVGTDKQETEHIIAIQKAMDSTRIKPTYPCTPMEVGLVKYAKNWDKYQPRAIVDYEKVFWERNKNKGLCSICEGLDARINLSATEKAEIESALRDDQLRSPYALQPLSYGGYRPNVPRGIPLRKTLFKRYEPFVTSLMEVQGSYLKPKA